MCVSNLVGMFIQKIVMLADSWVSKSRVLSNNPNTLLSLLLTPKAIESRRSVWFLCGRKNLLPRMKVPGGSERNQEQAGDDFPPLCSHKSVTSKHCSFHSRTKWVSCLQTFLSRSIQGKRLCKFFLNSGTSLRNNGTIVKNKVHHTLHSLMATMSLLLGCVGPTQGCCTDRPHLLLQLVISSFVLNFEIFPT